MSQSSGCALFFLTLSWLPMAFATTFSIPEPSQDIIGEVIVVKGKVKEDLVDIGRKYAIGGEEIQQANPHIKGRILKKETDVMIPNAYILPEPRTGIVINLPELRLYYFSPDHQVIHTFPLGIGRQGWKTPVMQTKVSKKTKDPAWFVPASIQAAHAAKGDILPKVVPPGPNNPLGKYVLRLGEKTILLHGTNAPNTVGWRVSHGCMRMLPDDIQFLYQNVPLGTPVNIINQPFKVGIRDQKIYLEVQRPLHEDPAYHDKNYQFVTAAIVKALGQRQARIQWEKVYAIANQKTGIPEEIGTLVEEKWFE